MSLSLTLLRTPKSVSQRSQGPFLDFKVLCISGGESCLVLYAVLSCKDAFSGLLLAQLSLLM